MIIIDDPCEISEAKCKDVLDWWNRVKSKQPNPLSTDGYMGQPGHLYQYGGNAFVVDDPCVYGCGCLMSWNNATGPAGVDPYKGCPKRIQGGAP